MYEESKSKGRTPRVTAVQVQPQVLMAYRSTQEQHYFESIRVRGTSKSWQVLKVILKDTDYRKAHMCLVHMEQRSSATGGELFANKQLGLRLRAKVVLGGESAVAECQLTAEDGNLISRFG
jgi:hypothetical protein